MIIRSNRSKEYAKVRRVGGVLTSFAGRPSIGCDLNDHSYLELRSTVSYLNERVCSLWEIDSLLKYTVIKIFKIHYT